MKTKVVGVNSGPDKHKRQWAISKCASGQRLTLKREPDNPVDSNAVAVYASGKVFIFFDYEQQIGYLSASIAKQLADDMDAGTKVACIVLGVTGGGDVTYGLNVEVDF